MAGSFSDLLENQLLNKFFRNEAFSFPSPLYFGLTTTVPTDSSAGTEVSGNNYSRVSVTPGTGTFSSSTAGSTQNSAAITFPTATGGNWGAIAGIVVFSANNGGDYLFYTEVSPTKTVNDGDTASISANGLTVTLS